MKTQQVLDINNYCFNNSCTDCKLKKLCDEYDITPTTIRLYLDEAEKILKKNK